jgi:hypothetical protein
VVIDEAEPGDQDHEITQTKKDNHGLERVTILPWKACVAAVPEGKRKKKETTRTFGTRKEKTIFERAEKK